MGTHPIFESDFDCLTDKDFAKMFFGISFRDFLFRLRRNPSDGISFLIFHVCLFGIFNLIIGEEAAIWTRKYLYYHHNFSFFLFANILASLWALALIFRSKSCPLARFIDGLIIFINLSIFNLNLR